MEQLTGTTTDLAEVIAGLQAEVAALEAKPAKNHQPSKPSATRKYVLLTKVLPSWGKVPQQQADIAKIIASNFELDVEVPEAEVFAKVTLHAGDFPSLANSKQHPTYLFRYYRGLKKDAKHGGFVAREFLKQVG